MAWVVVSGHPLQQKLVRLAKSLARCAADVRPVTPKRSIETIMILSGLRRTDAMIGACSRFRARTKTKLRVVQRKSGPTMVSGYPGISRAVFTISRMDRKTTLKRIAVPILPATL